MIAGLVEGAQGLVTRVLADYVVVFSPIIGTANGRSARLAIAIIRKSLISSFQ